MDNELKSTDAAPPSTSVAESYGSENEPNEIEELAAEFMLVNNENLQTDNVQLHGNEDPTADIEAIASTAHIPSSFPKYFQDALFWPGRKPLDKSGSKRKQTVKEKIPAVLITKDFREYLKKKEDEKERLEKQKAERKIERELKKVQKLRMEEEKLKEKAEREIEKRRKEEENEKEKMERQLKKQIKENEKSEREIEKHRKEEEKLKEKAERQKQRK